MIEDVVIKLTKELNMKKFFLAICLFSTGCVSDSNDIDKILAAKEVVRAMATYPETLSFHEFSTKVNGDDVTLTFTVKNGLGVPETHTVTVNVH